MNSSIKKYSSPLTMDEQAEIALLAMRFFHVDNIKRYKPLFTIRDDNPFTLNEFTHWLNATKNPLVFKGNQVIDFIIGLAQKNFLMEYGYVTGSPPYNKRYLCMLNLSEKDKSGGKLFLGKYLGLQFIAAEITKNLARIYGYNKDGDEVTGSGILINEQVILTCAHVIKDITGNMKVEIDGNEHQIIKSESHPIIDIGAIIIENHTIPFHQDIALRNATLLEPILIAGFPRIPSDKSSSPVIQSGEIASHIKSSPVVQSGEVASHIDSYLRKTRLDLFTAISRPGNSGGPMMSIDGKLLGIVTETLERKPEETDNGKTALPFFAAIPADVIFNSFKELSLSEEHTIPWND